MIGWVFEGDFPMPARTTTQKTATLLLRRRPKRRLPLGLNTPVIFVMARDEPAHQEEAKNWKHAASF
jgi:hypothetical protein